MADQRQARRFSDRYQNFERVTRGELTVAKVIVSLLIPVALYFYSPWMAAIVAVPCGVACYWYVSQSVRRFLRK